MMNVLKDLLTDTEVERVGKLPLWVVDLMEKLAMTANSRQLELDHVRATLASVVGVGDEHTTTWSDPDGETPMPIGIDPDIRHAFGDGTEVSVLFRRDDLRVLVYGTGGLSVQPMVANEVAIMSAPHVRAEERR